MRKKKLPFQEAESAATRSPDAAPSDPVTTIELGGGPAPDVPASGPMSAIAAAVAAGTATDDELATWLGPDLALRLGADFAGQSATQEAFEAWHEAVTSPLGIERDQAFALFTGRTTAEQFAAELPEENLDEFLERFPQLQAAHQARLDTGAVGAGDGTDRTDGSAA